MCSESLSCSGDDAYPSTVESATPQEIERMKELYPQKKKLNKKIISHPVQETEVDDGKSQLQQVKENFHTMKFIFTNCHKRIRSMQFGEHSSQLISSKILEAKVGHPLSNS